MTFLKLGLGVLLGCVLALSAVACSGDASEPTDRSKSTTQKSETDETSPTPVSTADGGAAPAPSPAPKPGGC